MEWSPKKAATVDAIIDHPYTMAIYESMQTAYDSLGYIEKFPVWLRKNSFYVLEQNDI